MKRAPSRNSKKEVNVNPQNNDTLYIIVSSEDFGVDLFQKSLLIINELHVDKKTILLTWAKFQQQFVSQCDIGLQSYVLQANMLIPAVDC